MILSWGASQFAGDPSYGVVFGKLSSNPQRLRPLSISARGTAGRPAFLRSSAASSVATASEMFIDGVARYPLVNTLRLESSIGGRGSMNFTVLSDEGTYRPTDLSTVTFYHRGVRRFGGFVQRVVDEVIEGRDSTYVEIQCIDNRGYTDRVVVAKLYTQPIGGVLWIIFYDIWLTHLQQFGITFVYEGDPGVVLDDVLFHYITATECFDRLIAKAPGWAWWIDANKQFHLKQTNTAAAFSLSDTTRNWESMRVTLEAGLYRNRQWVLPSAPIAALRTDSFTGDGSTTSFITDYILTSKPSVKVATVEQRVAELSDLSVPHDWYYINNGQGIFQRFGLTPVGVGVAITVSYPNPWPLAVFAEDAAEIAARGLVEAVEHAKDVETEEEAQAIADGLLAAFSGDGIPELVEYETNEAIESQWPVPGTLQTIAVAHPATTGIKTIESVSSELLDLTLWKHSVRARKGDFNADYQTVLETLTKSARSNRDRLIAIAEWDLATVTVGAVDVFNKAEKDGIYYAWAIEFPTDPPTGADLIIDALADGVSILPSGNANKIVLPAGQATEARGIAFLSVNLAVTKGTTFTLNVIQAGSSNPGTVGKVRLLMLAK